MIRFFFFFAICFAAAVASFEATAQSSFSMQSYRIGPAGSVLTAPVQTYNGGRLFFADGKHHLRVLGCEFVLNQAIGDTTPRHAYVQMKRKEMQALPLEISAGGHYMKFNTIGELTNGRRLDFTANHPGKVECDTGPGSDFPLFMIGSSHYLFASSIKDEIALIVIWNKETAISSATSRFDPTSAMVIYLKKDLFTPQQEDQALKMTGEVGLAIFRALIRR